MLKIKDFAGALLLIIDAVFYLLLAAILVMALVSSLLPQGRA